MNDDLQQQFGFLDARNHRLRRGIYLLPSALTVANLLCGFYAVLATFKGEVVDLDNAAKAIGIAMLFDFFDGFVARVTHTNSDFGKQFDSLADMVSFGIAPAILGFAWGIRSMLGDVTYEAHHVYQLGWLVSLAFVVCGAWRLARFNVHGMSPGGLRFFVGLPIPAAASMIAAMVHAVKEPLQDWRWSMSWLALMLLLATLMVSTIRYPSFKEIPWGKRQPSVTIVLLALLVWLVVVYSEAVLLLMISSYVLAGLTMHVARFVRHRLVSREE
jgi:CDP-diacylglycerol---serine O-phosphatidyltransferase